MDEMGECGTMQDLLARSMDNGKEQDQFPHQVVSFVFIASYIKTHFDRMTTGSYRRNAGRAPEISTTNLRPDIVLWSGSACLVHLVELTVPEDAVDEAYERKKLQYAQLTAEAEQRGWRVQVCPVEVGCQGFVAHSTSRFLRDIIFSGQVATHSEELI
ncbi:UNVERIFIED_CONTAM: hypothetical protein FKN15_039595 [Acipenser sinensis]